MENKAWNKLLDYINNNRWFFIFLFAIPFFNDSYYSISDYFFIDTGLELAKVLVEIILIVLLFVKRKKLSLLTSVLIAMQTWWMISTIINYGFSDTKLLYKVFIEMTNAVSLALLVEYFRDDGRSLVNGLMLNMELAIYPNIVSVVLRNIPGDRQYLLGFYAVLILWTLPALCIASLYMIVNRKYARSIVLIGATLFTIIRTWCATVVVATMGMVGLIVLGLILYKLRFKNKISLSLFVIIALLANVFIVFFYSSGGFSFPLIDAFITKVLNRSTTFTNRVYIWQGAMDLIKQKPLIGYGGRSDLFIESLGVLRMHCHNQILQSLYITGIIGLVLFAVFHVILCIKVDKNKNTLSRLIMTGAVFAIAITYITEAYKKFFRFYLVFFMAYYIDEIIESSFNNKDYLFK